MSPAPSSSHPQFSSANPASVSPANENGDPSPASIDQMSGSDTPTYKSVPQPGTLVTLPAGLKVLPVDSIPVMFDTGQSTVSSISSPASAVPGHRTAFLHSHHVTTRPTDYFSILTAGGQPSPAISISGLKSSFSSSSESASDSSSPSGSPGLGDGAHDSANVHVAPAPNGNAFAQNNLVMASVRQSSSDMMMSPHSDPSSVIGMGFSSFDNVAIPPGYSNSPVGGRQYLRPPPRNIPSHSMRSRTSRGNLRVGRPLSDILEFDGGDIGSGSDDDPKSKMSPRQVASALPSDNPAHHFSSHGGIISSFSKSQLAPVIEAAETPSTTPALTLGPPVVIASPEETPAPAETQPTTEQQNLAPASSSPSDNSSTAPSLRHSRSFSMIGNSVKSVFRARSRSSSHSEAVRPNSGIIAGVDDDTRSKTKKKDKNSPRKLTKRNHPATSDKDGNATGNHRATSSQSGSDASSLRGRLSQDRQSITNSPLRSGGTRPRSAGSPVSKSRLSAFISSPVNLLRRSSSRQSISLSRSGSKVNPPGVSESSPGTGDAVRQDEPTIGADQTSAIVSGPDPSPAAVPAKSTTEAIPKETAPSEPTPKLAVLTDLGLSENNRRNVNELTNSGPIKVAEFESRSTVLKKSPAPPRPARPDEEPGNVSDSGSNSSSDDSLSRRAEMLLANAKKRLSQMEGNLRGARSSLLLGSIPSRPQSVLSNIAEPTSASAGHLPLLLTSPSLASPTLLTRPRPGSSYLSLGLPPSGSASPISPVSATVPNESGPGSRRAWNKIIPVTTSTSEAGSTRTAYHLRTASESSTPSTIGRSISISGPGPMGSVTTTVTAANQAGPSGRQSALANLFQSRSGGRSVSAALKLPVRPVSAMEDRYFGLPRGRPAQTGLVARRGGSRIDSTRSTLTELPNGGRARPANSTVELGPDDAPRSAPPTTPESTAARERAFPLVVDSEGADPAVATLPPSAPLSPTVLSSPVVLSSFASDLPPTRLSQHRISDPPPAASEPSPVPDLADSSDHQSGDLPEQPADTLDTVDAINASAPDTPARSSKATESVSSVTTPPTPLATRRGVPADLLIVSVPVVKTQCDAIGPTDQSPSQQHNLDVASDRDNALLRPIATPSDLPSATTPVTAIPDIEPLRFDKNRPSSSMLSPIGPSADRRSSTSARSARRSPNPANQSASTRASLNADFLISQVNELQARIAIMREGVEAISLTELGIDFAAQRGFERGAVELSDVDEEEDDGDGEVDDADDDELDERERGRNNVEDWLASGGGGYNDSGEVTPTQLSNDNDDQPDVDLDDDPGHGLDDDLEDGLDDVEDVGHDIDGHLDQDVEQDVDHDDDSQLIRHEDRPDAFDYETFYLHSLLGSIKPAGSRRRDTVTSDTSTETAHLIRSEIVPTRPVDETIHELTDEDGHVDVDSESDDGYDDAGSDTTERADPGGHHRWASHSGQDTHWISSMSLDQTNDQSPYRLGRTTSHTSINTTTTADTFVTAMGPGADDASSRFYSPVSFYDRSSSAISRNSNHSRGFSIDSIAMSSASARPVFPPRSSSTASVRLGESMSRQLARPTSRNRLAEPRSRSARTSPVRQMYSQTGAHSSSGLVSSPTRLSTAAIAAGQLIGHSASSSSLSSDSSMLFPVPGPFDAAPSWSRPNSAIDSRFSTSPVPGRGNAFARNQSKDRESPVMIGNRLPVLTEDGDENDMTLTPTGLSSPSSSSGMMLKHTALQSLTGPARDAIVLSLLQNVGPNRPGITKPDAPTKFDTPLLGTNPLSPMASPGRSAPFSSSSSTSTSTPALDSAAVLASLPPADASALAALAIGLGLAAGQLTMSNSGSVNGFGLAAATTEPEHHPVSAADVERVRTAVRKAADRVWDALATVPGIDRHL